MRAFVGPLRQLLALSVTAGLVLSAIVVTVPPRIAYAGAYDTAVNGDHPAGYWRLGESTGTTAADASGGNHPGTYSGSYTLGATGAVIGDTDTAVNFTGGYMQSTYVQTSAVTYTAEAWIKTTASGGSIIRDRGVASGSSGKSLTLGLNAPVCGGAGAPYFGVDSDNLFVGVETSVQVNDGRWHHIAGTFNGVSGQNASPSQFQVYVDGRAVPGAGCTAGGAAPPFTGLDGMTVGYNLNATIDEAAVYTSVLSASQIRNHATVAGYLPGAPTAVAATAGANQASVSWTAPATTGATALSAYTVSAHSGGAVKAVVTVPSTSTTATIAGLQGATSYTFTVTASNSYGSSVDSSASSSVSVTGASSPYPVVIAGDSPSAYYRLDDTAAPLGDSSGNGNPLSQASSSLTLGATGSGYGDSRTAVTLAGGQMVSDYVQPAVNNFSVEAWINTTSAGGASLYTDRGILGSSGKSLTLAIGSTPCANSGGTLSLALDSDNTWIGAQTTAAYNDGHWHHVVGVYNGGSAGTSVAPSQFSVYVDGKAAAVTTCQIGSGTTPLAGLDRARLAVSYNGSLDELAIYQSALSAATVKTHWQAGGYTPTAPQAVSASATSGTAASVSWTAPDSAGAGSVTGYTVTPYAGTTAGTPVTVSGTTTTASVSGLTSGQTYTFQVSATNSFGDSPAGTSAALTMPGAPTPPQSVTATAGNGQASVTWSAPASDGGSSVTAYIITPYQGTTAGSSQTVNATTTSATVTGLTNGTAYTVQVQAQNAIGTGPAGVSNSVTPAAPPGAPATASASASNNQVTVTWTVPTSDGGSAVTGYTITPSSGANPVSVGASTLSTVFTNLPLGNYTFQVAASNVAGLGVAITTNSVTVTLSPPSAPASVTATSSTANQALVTWTAASANGGSLTRYLVTAISSGSVVQATFTDGNTTSTTITGLGGGSAYTFAVMAQNSAGYGPATTSASVTPSGSASTYVTTVEADSPSIYYRLGDQAAGIADSTGNGRNGDPQNTLAYAQAGPLVGDPNGSTNTANGYFQYAATAGVPAGNSARTVELWEKTSGTYPGPLFYTGSDGSHSLFAISTPGANSLLVRLGSDDRYFTTPYSIQNGNFHHVVVIWDGTSVLTAYLDGQVLGSQTISGGIATTAGWLEVGRGNCGYSGCDTFNGSIGELAVYGSALNATQVASHFNASGNTRPTVPAISSVTSGANSATVSWSVSTASSGAPVTGYIVAATGPSGTQLTTGTAGSATSAVITGLVGGAAYTFTVSALNNFGSSGPSTASSSVTPTGAPQTYSSTILGDTPTLYFRLGDGGGVTADSSGNGRSGVYNGGSVGAAGALPGDADTAVTNPTVTTATASGLPLGNSARTLEIWEKTTGSNPGPLMRYGGGSTDQLFSVDLAGGNSVRIGLQNDDHWFNAPFSLQNGGWHQVVVSWDGVSTMALYIDGQVVGTQTVSGGISTAGGGLQLGRGNCGYSGCDQFSGTLDEFSIYATQLSATQILNHFNASANSRGSIPGSVTATAGTNQATVSWAASTASSGAPVIGYLVTATYSGTSAGQVAVAGSRTSAVVSGLISGRNYIFRVAAINNFGVGEASAGTTPMQVGGSTSTYSSTVLGDSPSVYYRLGDSGGLAADSSGAGSMGTYSNGSLGQIGPLPGDPGTAYSAGVFNYPFPTAVPTGDAARSIEVWFKTVSGGPIYNMGNSQQHQQLMAYVVNGNQVRVSLGGDDRFFTSSYQLATGGWHHLVTTYSTGNLTVYIDGQSLGTIAIGTLSTPSTGFWLGQGSCSWQGCEQLSGTLGEVAVYRTALSAAQVTAHFNASAYAVGAVPSNVAATPGSNSTTVTWTGPAPFGGWLITAYQGTTAQNSVSAPGNVTSVVLSGLVGGQSYTFRVTAINPYGTNASADSAAVTPTGSVPQYTAAILADSPSLYYRLSEYGAPVAADSSGNGHSATLAGVNYSGGTPGALERDADTAMTWPGSSGSAYATYAGPDGLPTGAAARTVEGWFKTSGTTGTIAGYGNINGNGAFDLGLSGASQLWVHTWGTDPTYNTPYPVNDNAWHYAAATYDGSRVVVYLDGVQIGSTPAGLATALNSNGFTLGVESMQLNSFFAGSLDEVALYPSALSSGRIAAHWQAAGWVPGAPTGVTATAATNSAQISWTAPTYSGPRAITSYVITALSGTAVASTKTVDGNTVSVNFAGLSGSTTYTFTVHAKNQFGASAESAPTGAVTPTAPAMPSAGATDTVFGNYLGWRASNMPPFPAGTFAIESQTNLPAMSNWTVEFWMRNFGSGAVTYSGAGIGVMGGSTPGNPNGVTAGLGIDSGGGFYANYPGGSAGFSSYFARGGAPWSHVAISYDGATVRAFVNGQLQASVATTTASLTAGPAGIYDTAGIASLQLDELRISNTAEYTANFTPPAAAFPSTDSHTSMLWHFDDYGITRITKQTVDSSVVGSTVPNLFYDSSGNGAHGQLFMSNQNNHCCNQEISFYSLGQGLTMDELDASGSCWLCNHPQSHTDWPVNTATGEFWHTFDDLAIPGRGIPIDLSRNYGSLHASRPGPFGYGWSWSYGMSVAIDPNTSNATVKTATGADTTFTWNAVTNQYTSQPRTIATFTKNADGSYTLVQKDRSQLKFDAQGRLTGEVDKDGYATALTYDTSGNLHSVTDPSGRSIVFTWTGSNITGVADSAGRSVSYSYNANGDLVQSTDIGGGITTYAYSGTSHLLTVMKDAVCSQDANCPGVVNVYSGSQVSSQTDPLGRKTTFSYGGDGLASTTTITDPKGNVATETYVNGLLMEQTKGQGTSQQATWTYAYDPVTLAKTSSIDPLGHVTSFTYDSEGNLLTQADPLGRTTTYADYTYFNLPQHVTDPSGVTTTNSYDSNGHLLSTSRPLTGTAQVAVTSYSYDPANPGEVVEMVDADSKHWHYTYDANGYRNSTTDPLGNKSTSTYDSVGRLQATVDPRGNVVGADPTQYTTSYTFDAFGKPLTVTDPLGHQTVYGYNKNEQQNYLRDPNSHETRYVYDYDGELVNTIRPDLTSVQTTYDADANVSQQIDGLNHATTYTYDPLDRKATMADALNRTTTYGYDLAGNLTSLKDAKGQTTSYGYDAAGQLVSIQYSDGQTPNVTYSYDALGERKSMSDGTGTTTYSYDSLGRLTDGTNGAGAHVGYRYDLKSQLTSLVYPGSTGTVSRAYDDAGRLQSVTDWLSHTTTFGYDAASHLRTINYPNTVVATYTYDNAGRLMSIVDQAGNNSPFMNLTYGRDNAGQLTSDSSATPTSFGYDSLNRETSGPGSMTYSYDNADRITQINQSGGNQGTLAYDNADQLQTYTITNGGTQTQKYTYAFDANGNRTSQTDASNSTVTYGWDQANRMVFYGSTATYAYNGDGLRTSKSVTGNAEAFTWDIAEGLPLILQDAGTSFVTGTGGLPLEQISGGSVLYFHPDQLGSTVSLTDSAGAVQMSATYDAYGNIVTRSAAASTPFGYAGQYVDSESGLYYLRARPYDPTTGQFVAVDPLLPTTRGAYQYALGAPEDHTDSTGLSDDWQRNLGEAANSAWAGLVSATDRAASGFGKAVRGGDAAGALLKGIYRAPAVGRALAKAAPGIGFAIIFSEEYYGQHHSLLRSLAIAGASNAVGFYAAETAATVLGPLAVGGSIGSSETGVGPLLIVVGCAAAVGAADVIATTVTQSGLDAVANRAGIN